MKPLQNDIKKIISNHDKKMMKRLMIGLGKMKKTWRHLTINGRMVEEIDYYVCQYDVKSLIKRVYKSN